MMLTEVAPVAAAALPLAQFRDHLRMGSGFADDAVQDGLLDGYLRAALAAIEGWTGKAVLARDFRLTFACWRNASVLTLPLAPVASVGSVTIRDAAGGETVLGAAAWRLVADLHRPVLLPAAALFPAIPEGGSAEVVFRAGFGAWAAVPPDLAQAVLILAGHYHEERFASGETKGGMPFGIAALVGRWRAMRVGGGAL